MAQDDPGPADPWGAFLAPPQDEPAEDLSRPPHPGRGGPEVATAPPESVSELGPPPDDPMAAAKWAYLVHLRLAHVAFNDLKISQETREKRVTKLLAGAKAHMTDAMRFEVAQIIERDRRQVEARKRGRAAARKEAAPKVTGGAKIIPLRRDG